MYIINTYVYTYIINLDEYKSIGTHWLALFVNDDNVAHFVTWEFNMSRKNSNIYDKQKYQNKYLQNTSK